MASMSRRRESSPKDALIYRPLMLDEADLRHRCRRAGVQLGTVGALIAQLCIRHDLVLLTMDGDFAAAAKHSDPEVWKQAIARV